jgi:hypothetical protein
VSKNTQLILVSFITALLLLGCHASVPETASETITLMINDSKQGRYDNAIKVAQAWLKNHPDDDSENGTVYEQVAVTYLIRASKDLHTRTNGFSSPLPITTETSRYIRIGTLTSNFTVWAVGLNRREICPRRIGVCTMGER